MKSAPGAHGGRETARLMAVQALYQMDIAQVPLEKVIEEFNTHRLAFPVETGEGDGEENIDLPEADRAHFETLLRGVVAEQRRLDKMIGESLREGWALSRLDRTLRAIMRAGAYELVYCGDIPANVSIAEYTSMANAYFNPPEAGMANAIFEKIANTVKRRD